MKKRCPEWEQAKEIRAFQRNQDERNRIRSEYVQQREDYNNSPEGKIQESVRNSVQKVSRTEADAYEMIFQATKNLREETVSLIKNLVEDEKEELGYLKPETIKYAIEQTTIAINKIMQICNLAEYKKRLKKGTYTEYEKLFNVLMDEVDIGFAIVAPLASLTRNYVKYNKLSDKMKDLVFEHITSMGTDAYDKFMKDHYLAFKYQAENASCGVSDI